MLGRTTRQHVGHGSDVASSLRVILIEGVVRVNAVEPDEVSDLGILTCLLRYEARTGDLCESSPISEHSSKQRRQNWTHVLVLSEQNIELKVMWDIGHYSLRLVVVQGIDAGLVHCTLLDHERNDFVVFACPAVVFRKFDVAYQGRNVVEQYCCPCRAHLMRRNGPEIFLRHVLVLFRIFIVPDVHDEAAECVEVVCLSVCKVGC